MRHHAPVKTSEPALPEKARRALSLEAHRAWAVERLEGYAATDRVWVCRRCGNAFTSGGTRSIYRGHPDCETRSEEMTVAAAVAELTPAARRAPVEGPSGGDGIPERRG